MDRQLAFLDALQGRYEELLLTTSPETRDEEMLTGEATRADYQVLVEKVQTFVDQVNLYEEGTALIDSLEDLTRADNLSSTIYQDKIKALESQSVKFRRASRYFATYPEIEAIRERLPRLIDIIYNQAAKDLTASETASRPKSDVSPKPEKIETRLMPQLTVDLPKFSGDPMEWYSFKNLFTITITNYYAGAPQTVTTTLLTKAMESEEARSIVTTAAVGDKCYDDAFKALEAVCGNPAKIYPQYLGDLMKPETYTYEQKSLRRMRENIRRVMKGMESCKDNDFEHLIGGILIDRLDSQARHEWNSHGNDPSKLPTAQEVLDFFEKRELGCTTCPPVPPSHLNQSTQPRNQVHHPLANLPEP